MPQEIVKQRLGALTSVSARDSAQLVLMMSSLIDAVRVVTAKLDADAGVTDTNYTALFDALFTK